MSERTLEELLAVVARALGAEEARLVDAADEPPPDEATVRCDLPGGRRLIARLAAPAPDAAALQRRLEMLAETIVDLLPRESRGRPSRPPASRTLREELAALAQRANASDALVIDAHSPVIWGSATEPEPGPPSERAAPSAERAPVSTPRPPPAQPVTGYPPETPRPPVAGHTHPPETPKPPVAGHTHPPETPKPPVAGHTHPPETPKPPVAGHTHPPETPKPPAALHAVGPEDLAAVQYGLASAQGVRLDPGTLGVVPRAVCARHRVLPIARDGERLVLAMAEPRDAEAVHDVVLLTGLEVDPVFAGDSMAAFFQHLDDGGDTRTYDEVMAAIPAEIRASRQDRARAARDEWARTLRARRAVAEVRALPEMPSLHKGGHLRHMVSEPGFGYVARSFAAIYVLVLIYDQPFEELLAKRAITQALPTIERLVAALPPLDPPPPTAGVAAMRSRRRR